MLTSAQSKVPAYLARRRKVKEVDNGETNKVQEVYGLRLPRFLIQDDTNGKIRIRRKAQACNEYQGTSQTYEAQADDRPGLFDRTDGP